MTQGQTALETHDDPPLYRLRVAAAIAPMHEEPRVASQQVSQQLSGHDVDIMDTDGDWVRARGEDGYEGWMHHGFLDQDRDAPLGRGGLVSLGVTTERKGAVRRSLPLRAVLRPDERVVTGEAIDASELHQRFPLTTDSIARTAKEYFRGTSYVWGGVTPWGADCSGFAQSVYALHGHMLPRDAWQQAEMGSAVEGDFTTQRAGDLLFFTDRQDKRITHVAISLGPNEMVHLALGRGGYACELLDSDDSYVAKLRARFLFSRRLL
jgi:gamma-D-glutamyl-L-lysine dipeptidyl-peptidase